MKKVNIKNKLEELQLPLDSFVLGDFDQIGELTAKKMRDPSHPLYRTAGAFFRPNYERGILITGLIKRFEIKSFLEIGFGRGYASFCAAKAMCEMGWDDATVYSVDPRFDQNHLSMLGKSFPREWFNRMSLIQGTIDDAILSLPKVVDLVYIDGDHSYDAVKHDWESVKDRFNKYVLFDDYDPQNTDSNMQVKRFIDELEIEKELVITDRRIFFDDRRLSDSEIEYGQVLVKNPAFDASTFLLDW